MRPITLQTINLVKGFEGLRLVRYGDATGLPTIGYGHLIKPDENFMHISEEQALELLQTDLQIAGAAVERLIKVQLDDNEFTALIDFVYNLGAGVLQASTLKAKLNRGDYRGAANQFKRWVYAGATKLPGLIKRRETEAELFLS
jgi:GH24 family phage-related lysozyme (muramidase)